MTYTFKLSRRLAVTHYWSMLVLLLLSVAGCADSQPFDNTAPDAAAAIRETSIEVFPHYVYAEVNQPIQLRARERKSGREPIRLVVDWTASGGVISTDGLFSAARAGTYK